MKKAKTSLNPFQEKLSEYLKGLHRKGPRTVILPNKKSHVIKGFKVCKNTRKLGQTGWGYRRSLTDIPIKGKVYGSFNCLGGGGYFILPQGKDKIIQVQSFHKELK